MLGVRAWVEVRELLLRRPWNCVSVESGRQVRSGRPLLRSWLCPVLCWLVLLLGSCWLFGRLVGSWLALWEDRSRRRIERIRRRRRRLLGVPSARSAVAAVTGLELQLVGGRCGPGVVGSRVAGRWCASTRGGHAGDLLQQGPEAARRSATQGGGSLLGLRGKGGLLLGSREKGGLLLRLEGKGGE